LEGPVSFVCNLLSTCYTTGKSESSETLLAAFTKTETTLKLAHGILIQILGPHLNSKNMAKISSIFEILTVELIKRLFANPDLAKELQDIVRVLEYYSELKLE